MVNKPIGQDEKDRIGQDEMDTRRIEAGEFDAVSKEALAAEAHRRGLTVKANASTKELIDAFHGEG